MKKLRVYTYEKCGTCRKSLEFLSSRSLVAEVVPIREQPPTVQELGLMLGFVGGDLRRLFNTSGLDYRAMDIAQRLPKLSQDEALALLAAHGNLVKRPFAIWPGGGLVGFKLAQWESALD